MKPTEFFQNVHPFRVKLFKLADLSKAQLSVNNNTVFLSSKVDYRWEDFFHADDYDNLWVAAFFFGRYGYKGSTSYVYIYMNSKEEPTKDEAVHELFNFIDFYYCQHRYSEKGYEVIKFLKTLKTEHEYDLNKTNLEREVELLRCAEKVVIEIEGAICGRSFQKLPDTNFEKIVELYHQHVNY